RIFDILPAPPNGPGIQLGTNLPGEFNLRLDDSLGGSVLSNPTLGLFLPADQWVHVAINVDRTAALVTAYVNGSVFGSYSIAGLTGDIMPGQDLRIGAINFANDASSMQQGGLDDLAFYDGLLGAADIAALAAGTKTPLDFAGGGVLTTFCDPANANSTCFPAVLTGSWGTGIGSDLHLSMSGGVPGQLAYMLVGNEPTSGFTIAGANGPLCLVGTSTAVFYRYNVASTDMSSIGGFDAAGDWINVAGTATSTGGFGFDVPSMIPGTVPFAIMAGDTWHFQVWHRDTPAAAGSSNFSNGLSVTF
ncbi:MAG: hypothetical protein KDB61_13325, partial [Planctomycetes bacterium]|nr:hypothetical protein [Planctomycetota bacterium]